MVAHTAELPWRDNQRNVSCIPPGRYEVKRRWSLKYKSHWILKNVPNRSYILIHVGNFMDDTQGCILVGDRYLYEGSHKIIGVGNSVATMNALRKTLPDKTIIRII
jgi:hypothetical protein